MVAENEDRRPDEKVNAGAVGDEDYYPPVPEALELLAHAHSWVSRILITELPPATQAVLRLWDAVTSLGDLCVAIFTGDSTMLGDPTQDLAAKLLRCEPPEDLVLVLRLLAAADEETPTSGLLDIIENAEFIDQLKP